MGILREKEMFCLDAYLINGNGLMAYALSRQVTPQATRESLKSQASKWLKSDDVKEYLDKKRSSSEFAELKPVIRNREMIIQELNDSINNATTSKQKADILLKLADFEKMDKETEENKQVFYYLPLRCGICPFKEQAESSKEDNKG